MSFRLFVFFFVISLESYFYLIYISDVMKTLNLFVLNWFVPKSTLAYFLVFNGDFNIMSSCAHEYDNLIIYFSFKCNLEHH